MTFHIPSQQEFADLKSIMDGLSLTTSNDYKVKLHMPFVGYRKNQDADLYFQGTSGFYWSSSTAGASDAYYLSLSSSVNYNYSEHRSYAFPVRCFNNAYLEPDNTWTVVEGSLGSAGIFYNSTLGLISVTNGTDKSITMKDKNEGATVVYNDGDTLTQANMGKMHQWGNYYGFPSIGTISSTSPNTVSTAGYGNDNPYSSNIFIRNSNYDWSNPANDSLWAGSSDEYFEREGHTHITVSVYNKAGDTLVHTFDDVYSDSTISILINSGDIPGITELSTTINGIALSIDTVLVDGTSYYDVTPVIPPIPTGAYITKVYHNNQEYTVGGVVNSGSSYTEGAGIDITNNVISADMTTAVYDNTTSGLTADNVQDAIDEVFQSVSNGKGLIADAITDKGVSTSATDSFQTMAENIAMLPSRSVITDSLFKLTTDNYSHTSDKSRKSLETVFFNWDYSFNDEAYVAIRVYLDNAGSGSSDRYADEEIFYKRPGAAWETYMAGSSNYGRKGDFCLLKKGEEFKTLFYYGTTPNASTTSKTTVFEYTINKNEITRQLIYDSSSWESATIGETEYNNELNTLLSDGWEDVSSMPGLGRATYSQTSGSGSNYYTKITVSH